MESNKIIPKGILFPFILLTTLFFAWLCDQYDRYYACSFQAHHEYE